MIHSRDTNPDTADSIILSATFKRENLYAYEPFVMVSQVITRESLEDFTEDEIFSIREILYTDPEGCGDSPSDKTGQREFHENHAGKNERKLGK